MDTEKLNTITRLICFSMKVRIGLADEDLADRFGVHPSTISRNFHHVIEVLHVKLRSLISWPDRDTLRMSMPNSFRRFFKSCCVIVDCTEFFVERLSDLEASAVVWRNYKHHSTIKILIGITPQGTICFVSPSAGGRMSDKEIVEKSGFINYLLPGRTCT